VSVLITLHCDQQLPGGCCARRAHSHAATATGARTHFNQTGWRQPAPDRDLCPIHSGAAKPLHTPVQAITPVADQ